MLHWRFGIEKERKVGAEKVEIERTVESEANPGTLWTQFEERGEIVLHRLRKINEARVLPVLDRMRNISSGRDVVYV